MSDLEPQWPTPTTDRAQALRDLETSGYCIVQNALTPGQTTALRERVIGQCGGEEAAGVAFHDSRTNQRVWNLINKGRMFRDLAIHPLAVEMMSHLLGKDFLLSSLTANIAKPGGDPMYLHTDQGYIDFWTPKPVVANILWMLDDFTDENGGTRLVPGSHLSSFDPAAPGAQQRPSVAARGPAGSALVFDGRLIHGTGANRTAGTHRHAILTYYCRPFVRQQENAFLALDPAVRATEREAFLGRLGYRIWAGLGRVESPAVRGLVDGQSRVGPLDASGNSPSDPPLPN